MAITDQSAKSLPNLCAQIAQHAGGIVVDLMIAHSLATEDEQAEERVKQIGNLLVALRDETAKARASAKRRRRRAPTVSQEDHEED